MRVFFLLLFLAGFAATLVACKAACPVLDLAATACPLFTVLLPDGTTEVVPRAEFARAAMKTRSARLERDAGPDGD